MVGPRLASASLVLITAPAVFFTPLATSSASFLLVRFFTGFSLATFVSTQYWMSSMFSSPVVGTANGVAGGWGNLGGGATQLIMPLVFALIRDSMGSPKFTAWRIAFYVPGVFQMLTAFAVLIFGQDLPDGNFRRLQKTGDKSKDKISDVLFHGVTNYRGWILALTYGYCFGVELTVDNVIAEYFYDRFNLKLHTAGLIAASFGLANLILGRVNSLGGSIVVMILFSFFCQAACGLTFGVVPFVSRRSLGLISGMTGGGGNVGAVITQLAFFKGSRYSKETGITYMGIMIICCTLPLCLINFPQWGGMFTSGRGDGSSSSSEEDYYMAEWNSEEKNRGLHQASLKFAENSRRERGRRSACNTAPATNDTSLSPPAEFAA
ncbi:unnamed protein product [Linum tenue]|uniref:High affinity nitrate transporter 2.5 n=1 Tax=Linum tenue TaxID=586396 RepID=A0AAV0R9H2_9ROSI|nr:unnamed protein product [Linum tenue]